MRACIGSPFGDVFGHCNLFRKDERRRQSDLPAFEPPRVEVGERIVR